MNILSIGTDRSIFIAGSEVGKRQIKQGEESGGRVEIIVFALRRLKLKTFDLSPKVRVIPTNSPSRWLYVFDAVRIGKRLPAPDLVAAQDPFECGLVAWRLAGFFHSKLSLQIHTDLFSPYFAWHPWINLLRVFIASRLLPRADVIRVDSERIKYCLEQTKWKLKTVPFVQPVAVNIDRIKNSPIVENVKEKYLQFNKIVLMVSRLESEKNIKMALGAFRYVIKEYPQAGLVIVGRGSQLSCLQLLSKKYGLEKNVVFAGWQSDEIVFSYYKTADLFLNTSFYEGYSVAMVEAKAAGCRILAPDVSGAKEIGAEIFEFNEGDLASKIISLIS